MNKNQLQNHLVLEKFVILSKQNRVTKYISKNYKRGTETAYTLLLNRARKFDSKELALGFLTELNIKGNVKTIRTTIKLIL